MRDRRDMDGQFRETPEETRIRWRDIKAKRRREGKCWQCAKPLADVDVECGCGAKN